MDKNKPANEITPNNYIIPGYRCEEDPHGRGVCIFVKENIKIIRYPEIENIFRPSIFCKIIVSKGNSFTLGVVYRSPNGDNEDAQKSIPK